MVQIINQEKIKLNKDHSAEPEDFEDDFLSYEDLEVLKEKLTPFQYMSLTKDYLGEFDSEDIVFRDDFSKFKNFDYILLTCILLLGFVFHLIPGQLFNNSICCSSKSLFINFKNLLEKPL